MTSAREVALHAQVPTSAERLATNTVAPPPPASLFQGSDSVNGYGISTAVEGTYASHGGSSSVFYQVALDVETLYQALDISQSVSVGFGPLGSVSEKSEFVQQLSLTSYSLNIVVHARHVKGTDTATAFKLKDGINPPQDDAALRNFFRSYGDSFVSSITTGAEYYAVYTFYAQSREEQDSVSAELKANGIFDFGSVGADLQTKLNRVTEKTQVRISFNQNVAGIANPKLPTPEQLVQYALDFPSIPIDAPAILSFGLTGYEHVPDVGSFEPIAGNRTFLIGNQSDGGLAQDLVKETQLINQIGWLKSIYAFYQGFNDSKLNEVASQAQTDQQALNEQFTRYVNDPTAKLSRPSTPSLQQGSPKLQYQIAQSPAQGGDGGDPFDDVDINTYLQRQDYVSSIQLRSGGYVDAISVTYRSNSSGDSWNDYHGGGGGGQSQTLTLQPGQFITQVSGRSGRYVDQLRITISDGRSVGGGGGGGSAFDWTVPSGSVVLGFYGRSGKYLDQIGVTYATLKPAQWVK
ncbi:jacalin-like lectin [Crenobacter sp. SG2305]|uniref:jacalin-like lectin n=1 Tax=Crenobacter oryzisoli TaxID=3056844 RepID=UPI0025AA34F0|nr:jacalin-like lectin [Crenobacter sp. SG2305]MDN0084081.1 jacalin-like lectin [Crenobacter sp. SG2305]